MESFLYDSKNSQTYRFGLHILDYVPRNNHQSIIDIGSGSGSLTKELTFYGGNVIGVDKSINAVKSASAKHPTVPFYVMDACRLQYENRFDIAFSNAMIHEVKDKDKLFASIYKALKKGGKLIAEFAAKNGNQDFFICLQDVLNRHNLPQDIFTYYLIDKDECVDLLENAGFTIENIEEVSRKSYYRGDDDSVKDHLDKTISRDIPEKVREEIKSELMKYCTAEFKSARGWMKDICRLRIVASK